MTSPPPPVQVSHSPALIPSCGHGVKNALTAGSQKAQRDSLWGKEIRLNSETLEVVGEAGRIGEMEGELGETMERGMMGGGEERVGGGGKEKGREGRRGKEGWVE